MKTVNALAIRKSLGSVLLELERTEKPVCVTRDRKPVAVLIPFEMFRQRFVDFLSQDDVENAMRELEKFQSASTGDSLRELAKLREGIRS
jgi:prevent-host-death family protein